MCRYVSICLVWHHGILFLYVFVKVLWLQENLIVLHLRATVNCSLFSLALHFCSWSSECYILCTGSVFYPVPEHCCYCGWVITWQPCICQEFRAHSSSAFHVNYLIQGSWSGDIFETGLAHSENIRQHTIELLSWKIINCTLVIVSHFLQRLCIVDIQSYLLGSAANSSFMDSRLDV